MIDNWIKGSAW